MSGRLYGIGVGPGDPELMTLKAVRVLAEAPVVAYPAPDKGESSARKIAAAHIPAGRIEIAIRVPMRPGPEPAAIYDDAAKEIAAHLEAGRDVAVLCEGDPLFYGSFIYLHDRLAHRFPTTVVPGVSSLTACAAAADRAARPPRRDADGAPRDAFRRRARSAACRRRRRRDPQGRPASAAAEGAARSGSALSRRAPMSRMRRAPTSASCRSPISTRRTRPTSR